MAILKYWSRYNPETMKRESITPCPYRDGVIILSKECRACNHYGGECVTHNMICNYENN